MTPSRPVSELTWIERINFLLTNRIPRRWVTLLVGRLSRIENRLFTRVGSGVWQLFGGDLALHEALRTDFTSLRECFTRQLKPGARPIDGDPRVITSPCDALVGAHGDIDDITVLQAKGFTYTLMDLLGDEGLVEKYRSGVYATLRLRSNMYHRFHAPVDGRISRVTYISGDTWNVNSPALRQIERLFCKNERVVLDVARRDGPGSIGLVAVAAILVASIKLRFLDDVLDLKYRGPNTIACNHSFTKGEELGYFQLGSTIVLFGTRGFRFHRDVAEGRFIRMGEPLLTDGGVL